MQKQQKKQQALRLMAAFENMPPIDREALVIQAELCAQQYQPTKPQLKLVASNTALLCRMAS